MKLKLAFFSLFISILNLRAQTPSIALEDFASGFSQPVEIANAGDSKLYIVERAGKIKTITPGSNTYPVFMDITNKVVSAGQEQGLLGLAFHPNYAVNGYFYVYYTGGTGNGFTVVARYSRSVANPNVADTSTGKILFTVTQPYSNHNGGCIKFGPDGYLYISLGDGGSGGDPQGYAQSLTTKLGKILRIDVNGSTPNTPYYSVPSTNPFFNSTVAGIQKEIWAYGLRNVWKFSIDKLNGDLWLGDVGQGTYEEVDYQLASSLGGENYGWRCYEGNTAYNTTGCAAQSTMVAPVHVYSHGSAGCSITGGFRYRGTANGLLYGGYLFTDYCSGLVKMLTAPNVSGGTWSVTTLVDANNNNHSAFGEDVNGELYVAELANGKILRVKENSCKPSAIITNNTNVIVTCTNVVLNALTGPTLSYQWLLNGTPISGATSSSYTVNNFGSYALKTSQFSIGGCSGSDTSATIQVYFNAPQVLISTTSSCSSLNQGSAVSSVTGGTSPYIYSWSNGSTASVIQGLGVGTYSVDVTDANGCFATASGTVNSSVCGVPIVTINNITSTQFNVNWNSQSCALKYRVQIRKSGDVNWTTYFVTNPGLNKLITGLLAATTYSIRVRTQCNSSGSELSAWSATQTVTTLGGVSNCVAPSSITVTNIANSSANISWALISGSYGYQLRYKTSTSSTWIPVVLNNQTNTYTIPNLVSNTTYNVQIRTKCILSPLTWSAYSQTLNFNTALRIEEDVNFDNQFSIYPNPASNNFTINCKNLSDEILQVSIFNSLGQRIYISSESVNPSSNINIDINNWTKGVYIVEINSSLGITRKKLVIE